ncbi:MAG: hypothetical protein ACOY5Y_02180 [Pseudomonadota bacterium]
MSATKIGQQYVRFGSATTATAVFLPAANANGAYLRTGTIVAQNPTATTSFVLVADTSAPANVSSGRAILVLKANAGTATSFSLPYELEVPAGWGVWAIADSTSWGVNITFDTIG